VKSKRYTGPKMDTEVKGRKSVKLVAKKEDKIPVKMTTVAVDESTSELQPVVREYY